MRELFRKHNLLNKVFNYEDEDSCPLCEKRFVNDDLVDFSFGKPIHLGCLEKLNR
jgi:hypothetical protein